MKINRNMSAVVANRQLLRTENKLSLSMGRLSSGYKINKAGDNPAGMAISSKMKAQIDGLDQAEANSDDGQSVLRIADGALNEVSNMLQRIRELSVQAANGTNSYSDRQSIQDEIDQLTQEVDRISTDTEYNKKTLLDGSANTRVYVSGTHQDKTKFARSATRIDFSEEVLPGDYTVKVKTPAKQAEYKLDLSGLINDPDFDGGTVSINGVGIDYEKGMSADDVYKQLMSVADEIGCKIEKDPNNAGVYNITADNKGSKETLTILMSDEMAHKTGLDQQGAVQNADDKSYKLVASGTDAEIELKDGFGSTVITNVEGNRVKITDKGGFSMDFLLSDDVQNGDTLTFDVTDVGAMTIQIGANQYQNMDVHIPEVSSESLYLDTVNVAVNGGADKAISTMDAAIAKLSAVRSGIGAYTNRLEYASSSLAETQEDMTTAYSGLMDTDMASEMTEYTQQNILEQAAVSVLSQANDIPQQVLSLLQK
ncbi:flagellin N-terminal helical domain-containing protein [Roseburia faecis]|uniref:Flagellin n=1 Tax=Roseburia faecis TaxID=301302 RepID=A0A173T8R6_9FIRM|nr:flagellin [Roseburia faecis]CUM98385.1 Flagellin [Roseburia faecis]